MSFVVFELWAGALQDFPILVSSCTKMKVSFLKKKGGLLGGRGETETSVIFWKKVSFFL